MIDEPHLVTVSSSCLIPHHLAGVSGSGFAVSKLASRQSPNQGTRKVFVSLTRIHQNEGKEMMLQRTWLPKEVVWQGPLNLGDHQDPEKFLYLFI